MELKKKLSNPELIQTVKNLIQQKWHEQFPDDFIHCTTTDKEVYNSTKGYAYNTYIDFIRNIDTALNCNHPEYKVTDADGYCLGLDFQIKEQQKLLDDIKNCENIKLWCIDNIGTH